jgi:copper(I)-binding protein
MKARLAIATIFSVFMMQAAFAGKGVVVSDAWVREAPPGATALGGFMVIKNNSNKVKSLVKASSPDFGMVQLHRTMQVGDMMKMVHQKKIDIPANGSTVFKPGDYHIMLMKPKKSLKAGDHVMVTLGFADGSEMTVKYTVRKGSGMGMKHDMHGDGHMKMN